MPNFPVSQDTWARKVNRDLSIDEIGDDLDQADYNDWAIWLEAFQNVLGYNILGGYGTLVERLNDATSLDDNFFYSLLMGD